ncbi:MAG: hypothetical protein IPM55_10440 [Acidobacteria bacterium]|nr:hypothetical protein [Acidobacteriota bacterium]
MFELYPVGNNPDIHITKNSLPLCGLRFKIFAPLLLCSFAICDYFFYSGKKNDLTSSIQVHRYSPKIKARAEA